MITAPSPRTRSGRAPDVVSSLPLSQKAAAVARRAAPPRVGRRRLEARDDGHCAPPPPSSAREPTPLRSPPAPSGSRLAPLELGRGSLGALAGGRGEEATPVKVNLFSELSLCRAPPPAVCLVRVDLGRRRPDRSYTNATPGERSANSISASAPARTPGAGPGSTAKDASASCASTSVSFCSRARRQPHRAAARGNVPGSRSNSASRIASASSSPTGPGSSATSARVCAAVHRSLARARFRRTTADPSEVIRTHVRRRGEGQAAGGGGD